MIRLLAGDCRDVLATLPADSVHTVVTSPPYYGLRDYGTAQWDGGDAGCDHAFRPDASATSQRVGRSYQQGHPHRECQCGATRVDRQIGLEATPDEYLATMVGVFREVRRVLRPDGTCWVNMGDSYAGSPAGNFGTNRPEAGVFNNYRSNTALNTTKHAKPKDLLMMPARLALALQADGWWVRSDIIWHKPNPMPESCRDRPTSAHEHVFLLTKSARYYYDADAVREAHLAASLERVRTPVNGYAGSNTITGERGAKISQGGSAASVELNPAGRNCRNVWTIATAPYSEAHFATFPPALAERCIKAGTSERGCCSQCGKPWVRVTERNMENVPTRLSTKRAPVDCEALGAYLRQSREALGISTNNLAVHFPSATGGLTGCVRNWELGLNTPMPEQWAKLKEVLGLDNRFDEQIYGTVEVVITDYAPNKAAGVRSGSYAKTWNSETATTGWRAGCDHNGDVVPCVVLDCFAGAGTTLLCADRLQRDAIGIELNTAYTEMAMERCRDDAPLFVDAPAGDPEDERMADLFAEAAE